MAPPPPPLGANLIFLLFILLFSLAVVKEQARSCHNLDLQKNASRVLLLPIVYSFCTFVGAYVEASEGFFDVLMALYEAYVLYCFFSMMVISAGGCKSLIPRLIEDPPYVFRICRIPILYFNDGDKLFHHFRRSVVQLMFTRPFFLACCAIASAVNPFGAGVRVTRVLALLCLIYTMTALIHFYLLLRNKMLGMDAVRSFLILKGYVLLLTLQDFALTLALNARGEKWSARGPEQLIHAYSLLVAVESLFFIPLMRTYFKPHIFAINADSSMPMGPAVNLLRFLLAVVSLTHVLENEYVNKPHQIEEQPFTRGGSNSGADEVELRDVTIATYARREMA